MSFEFNCKGIGTVLFLIFMILKLCDEITWSWWWVTAPLWLPITIIGIVLGFLYILLVGVKAYEALRKM